MKITINAFGSRGDVQPYIALGKGLRAAGFEVLITTHKIFKKLTLENGLDCYPIDANPHDVLVSQAVAEIGNNPVKISRRVAKNINPVMKDMFQITLKSANSADLIINSLLSFAGYHGRREVRHPFYWRPLTTSHTNEVLPRGIGDLAARLVSI